LINYAGELREFAQDFDIDNIEVTLKELIEILENVTPMPENIAKFPELIEELKNKMIPLWENINNNDDEFMETFMVEDFANTLVKRASEYNLPDLINYAEKLHEYNQNLDRNNVKQTLKEFLEIIPKLDMRLLIKI